MRPSSRCDVESLLVFGELAGDVRLQGVIRMRLLQHLASSQVGQSRESCVARGGGVRGWTAKGERYTSKARRTMQATDRSIRPGITWPPSAVATSSDGHDTALTNERDSFS